MQALIEQENTRAARSRVVGNRIHRVMPTILRNINASRAFLVVGHGVHKATSGDFIVPPGKRVIFLSKPGVSLSEVLISDPKFTRILQDKVRLAKLISNPASLGNSRPAAWRDVRNKIYIPGKSCPDLELNFWDYKIISRPGQPIVQVPGQLQKYMGVWRLPFTGLNRNRTNLHNSKTLGEVVRDGSPGVYIVYACRRVTPDVNWENMNAVYSRVRNVIPNIQTYRNFLAGNPNSAARRRNYISNIRMTLQNIGLLHLIPFRQNASGVGRITNVESRARREAYHKRVGNNNSSSNSGSNSSRTKRRKKNNGVVPMNLG